MFWRRKKYRVKKLDYKVSGIPKKSKKADLRRYSTLFFLIGYNLMAGLAYIALEHKTIFPADTNGKGSKTTTVVHTPKGTDPDKPFKILKIDPKQLETLINAEALTHAIWPGYKGDPKDGRAVRKHFQQQLANYIVKTKLSSTLEREYRIQIYYVVRDDGSVQFLGLKKGEAPAHILKGISDLMAFAGGIKPGTGRDGKPITVVYELALRLTPS